MEFWMGSLAHLLFIAGMLCPLFALSAWFKNPFSVSFYTLCIFSVLLLLASLFLSVEHPFIGRTGEKVGPFGIVGQVLVFLTAFGIHLHNLRKEK